jgi:DNA-binding Lrp family transcriptional regulator
MRFDPRTLCNDTAIERRRPVRRVVPDERGRRLFRALQSPLPLEERAFAALAAGHGLDEAELLAFGRAHLGGAVRRYVATLRHRQLGVRANGMVVWRVGEDRLRRAGEALARAPEVSHCYARESAPGFPYTLYSMVHGPDEAACRTIATRLAADAGLDDHLVLFSRRELKKCRLRYFLPELDDWWRARATEAATPGTGSQP